MIALGQRTAEAPLTLPPWRAALALCGVVWHYVAILAFTSRGNFDSAFRDLTVVSIGDGHVEAELPVTTSLSNTYGTLHGGASATAIDIVGTMALLSRDPTKPGVSIEINSSYASAAKIGEKLRVVGRCVTVSRHTKPLRAWCGHRRSSRIPAPVQTTREVAQHCLPRPPCLPSNAVHHYPYRPLTNPPCPLCLCANGFRVLKAGKKLGFTQVDIFREDGAPCCAP